MRIWFHVLLKVWQWTDIDCLTRHEMSGTPRGVGEPVAHREEHGKVRGIKGLQGCTDVIGVLLVRRGIAHLRLDEGADTSDPSRAPIGLG
jgi:hypothetical protein